MATLGLPLALDGSYASPGTVGYWLDETDVVFGGEGVAIDLVRPTFPRDWPAVFKSSTALKSLVNRKLRGVRCRAIAAPPKGADAATALEAITSFSLQIHPYHSFSNSLKLAAALPGWQVVKGFIVFEQLEQPAGDAFLAMRHWWVSSPTGTWIDLTPPLNSAGLAGSTDSQALLVESPLGDKSEAALDESQQTFAAALASSFTAPPPIAPEVMVDVSDMRIAEAAQGAADERHDGVGAGVGAASQHGCSLVEQAEGQRVANGSTVVEARKDGTDELRAEADALYRSGDATRAEELYKQLAEPVVEGAVEGKERGNAKFKAGDMEGANAEYEEALTRLGLDPRRFNYFSDQAAAEFGQMVRRATPNGLVHSLHSNRAAALLKLSRNEEAEKAASLALKEKPSDPKARVRRASALRALCKHAAAAAVLAQAMQRRDGVDGELAHMLTDVWCERAPEIEAYVAEVRAAGAAAGEAGGGAKGSAAGVASVERALCCALHGIGTSGDWARSKGGMAKGATGARLLARKSIKCFFEAARVLAGREYPETDHEGARCLLRLASWIVGISGVPGVEAAIVDGLHEQVLSSLQTDHYMSTFEALSGPEPVCVELLQLLEALVRRRVSNLKKLDHPLEVLLRIFSFRSAVRVRAVAISLLAWCARCPKTRDMLFSGRYDERILSPINTAMKDYARLLQIPDDLWVVDPDSEAYTAETGICLSDGGLHSGKVG